MLTLRSSTTSPFGRKVKIAALLTGHSDKIKIVATDTMSASDPLRQDNPLGKIPCLVLEDGTALYDSRVILDYLDHEAGGGVIIPRDWPMRLAALRMQALGDGIMDAAILVLYEGRFRKPDMHDATWVAHQTGKRDRGLAFLEANPPQASASPHMGAITVFCALEWLEFRFSIFKDGQYPRLAAFVAGMRAALPGVAASDPHV